jgi:hypothetical protein
MRKLNVGTGLVAVGLDLIEKDGWLCLKGQVGSKAHRSLTDDLSPGWVHFNTTGSRGYQFHVRKPVLSSEMEPGADLTKHECEMVAELAAAMGDSAIATIFDQLARASA